MKKKFLIVCALLFTILFFGISYTFAANNAGSDAVNGIRNFVGGAENVVEDIGRGAANGIKNGVNALENGAKNVTDDATNNLRNGSDNMANRAADNNNNSNNNGGNSNNNAYTATRTSTDTTATGILGNVSDSVWTWLIVGIVGIIIVALVMYYAKQNTNVTNYEGHNNDDE